MTALTSTHLPPRRPSGLVAAFLVALGLHALALVAVMFLRLTPPAPPGEQQVTVDLAPVMTEIAPEEAPPVAATEVAPVQPQDQVVTSTAEQAEPLAAPPVQVAKPVEEEKPVEPEKPKVDLAKLKAEKEARLRKIREEKRKEEERRERLEEIREAKEAKAKAAREAKAREVKARQGAERASASSSRENAAGRAAAGSDPSALRQWTGAISAAIHGRMNPGAAAGTSGGTAVVRFTVMRSGSVTGAGLARSSGVGQIDSAALAAVRGGLPAAPAGVTQPSLSVTIPLNYRVR